MSEQFLYQELASCFKFSKKPEIPMFVKENMPSGIKLRDYQEDALKYFIQSYESSVDNGKQIWNLFHMATGAGKTNMMAAVILYLYEKGYSNFIFLVNSVNIVEKTKDNFLNTESKKYLFARNIVINKKRVSVISVDNFANVDDDEINIMFTTIQGLHDRLTTQKENSVSFSDFNDKKIVLIADEAHHFSASTKKPSKKEQDILIENEKTWEETIKRIWESNGLNILLEFTATCDLKNQYVIHKYKGNPADIVYNYPLLDFRSSGYTKDLLNLRTTLSPMNRTIQAMLLSQYRLKIFEKNGVTNSKPVILLKAHKEIANLDAFYEEFVDYMENSFDVKDIESIRKQADGIIKRMFDYFAENNIDDRILVQELKQSFSSEHIVKVHSKIPEISELQKHLNNLEDIRNPYRMVMTLDMLHEGWDVLNLFDIVRLYDERQGGKSTAVKSTIQEAQLIGRGARYFPFSINGFDNPYKRKYDDDLTNELRVCETLYYHCVDDSIYITEIKKALEEIGFEFSEEQYIFDYKVKQSFKNTRTFNEGKLFVNERVIDTAKTRNTLFEKVSIEIDKNLLQHSNVSSLYGKDESVTCNNTYKGQLNHYSVSELFSKYPSVVMKAIRQFPIYKFDTLQQYFPDLSSHAEFVSSSDYAGQYELFLTTASDPTNIDIYQVLLDLFEQLSTKIKNIEPGYRGTKEFHAVNLSDYVSDKSRLVNKSTDQLERTEGEGISQSSPYVDEKYRLDLSKEDWFVYEDHFGTTEEKRFVMFFAKKVNDLKKNYDEIYLIRNERHFCIYDFDDGRRFEPDYVLILVKSGTIMEQQQIFIEPKGSHLIKQGEWKEKFLLEIEKTATCKCYHDTTDEFKVYGLPFYNHTNNLKKFENEFDRITK